MRVIVTPYPGDGNPYLKLLSNALEATGVEVCLAPPRWALSLYSAVLTYGKPDLIHLHWHHTYFTGKSFPVAVLRTLLFFLEWLTLRALGIRFAWTVHNVTNHENHQARWELIACRLLARVVGSMIVHCAAAVPIVAAAYRIPAERLHIVPLGQYGDWYGSAPDRDEARRGLGLPQDAFVFLFFGQIRVYKGLDRLLAAFARLPAEHARLILVGQPFPRQLGSELLAQAAGDPRILPSFEFADDAQIVTYIGACDVVVLPYKDSLTSSAVSLATSYARPVLAPRLGCMRELPPETAILYDSDSPDGLQVALEQALREPLDQMGVAAQNYVRQFSWPLVATKTLAVYRSALSPGGEPPAAR